MHFVLLMIVSLRAMGPSADSIGLTNIGTFSTKLNCENAAQSINNELPNLTSSGKLMCIEVK